MNINRRIYLSNMRRDHKSYAVRKWFGLYAWFWFHTEFWLSPDDRRPYTYIMRDWIYPHMNWFITILLLWYFGMVAWSILAHSLGNEIACLVISSLSSWLAAHLIWGGGWIPGQQEWPPVTDH